MLFNSAPFVYLFLPLAFVGFFLLARVSQLWAAAWLTLASIFFYGWWNPKYVPLLIGSMLFNYLVARLLAAGGKPARHWLLLAGIAGNLLLLGYFKYAHFLLDTVEHISGVRIQLAEIVLPLGISFFTFTQIAFLVDTYRGLAREPRFLHYALFVTYFPHLIAGPILHHSEMMPQFARTATYRLSSRNVSVGLTIFVIGLFKKVILADNIAQFAAPAFNAAAAGHPLSLLEAWGAALAYALQLYFDFSGYSDMAIGVSRLFGITLPLNFNSPYKAANIIDFWRRWHMTLSRFLRDYLYFPLGGNRRGPMRRHLNLLLTMLLGGLWHGAGWTYVVWGGLHGCFLIVNHGWQALRGSLGWHIRSTWITRGMSIAVTFTSVLVGWVFFRAASISAANAMLSGMAGQNGVVLPVGWKGHLAEPLADALTRSGVVFEPIIFDGVPQIVWTAALLAIAWFWPNTQELMRMYEPALEPAARPDAPGPMLAWRPTAAWALAVAMLAVTSLASLDRVTQFLYFQF
ncbi:MAG: Peptidoglycan O-acetyltransferase [Gammaproteobacteria bacterium]|nr:Peptidoglycan O-acetyltransferase [Gammaproteobacteria bacterium]